MSFFLSSLKSRNVRDGGYSLCFKHYQTLLSRNSELENKVSLLERRLVQQENVKHAAEQDMQLKDDLTKALMVNAEIMTSLLRTTADFESEKRNSALMQEKLAQQNSVVTKLQEQRDQLLSTLEDMTSQVAVLRTGKEYFATELKVSEDKNVALRMELVKSNDDLSRLKSELVGIVNNKNIDSALLTGLSAPNQPVRVSFDVSEHKSTDQRVHFDSHVVENVAIPKVPKRQFLACRDGQCLSLCFDRTSTMLVTSTSDSHIKVWDPRYGTQLGLYAGPNSSCCSVSISNDNKLLMATSSDQSVYIWKFGKDVLADATMDKLDHTLVGHSDKVFSGMFLDNSHNVLTTSNSGFKVWSVANGSCVVSKGCTSSFYCTTSACAEGKFATAHYDKHVRIWTVAGDMITDIPDLHSNRITSVEFSPDSNYLLTNSKDSIVRVIDLRTNLVLNEFSHAKYQNSYNSNRASFSPDGKYILVGSQNGSVVVWRGNNGKAKFEKVVEPGVGHSKAIYYSTYNDSGSLIATCDEGGVVCTWE